VQEQNLLRWIGGTDYLYKRKEQEGQYFRAFARKSLQHAGWFAPQDQQSGCIVTDLTSWLKEVPFVLLRNGHRRIEQECPEQCMGSTPSTGHLRLESCLQVSSLVQLSG